MESIGEHGIEILKKSHVDSDAVKPDTSEENQEDSARTFGRTVLAVVQAHRCGGQKLDKNGSQNGDRAGSGFVRGTQDIYCPLVHTQKHSTTSRDPQSSRYDTSEQRWDPLQEIYLSKTAERR